MDFLKFSFMGLSFVARGTAAATMAAYTGPAVAVVLCGVYLLTKPQKA